MNNTFTYKQSELPEFRDEIKKEIADLDHSIGKLVSRCAGNYHELEALSELLNDGADSCELNLNCIRVIPDGGKQAIRLTDLSPEQKRIIYDNAFANAVMMQIIGELSGDEPNEVAIKVSNTIATALIVNKPDDKKIEEVVAKFANIAEDDKNASIGVFLVPL